MPFAGNSQIVHWLTKFGATLLEHAKMMDKYFNNLS